MEMDTSTFRHKTRDILASGYVRLGGDDSFGKIHYWLIKLKTRKKYLLYFGNTH
jgi:hypothetical protein